MRFSEVDGKTIGVWGLGRETRSFLEHLSRVFPTTRARVIVREGNEAIRDLAAAQDALVVTPDEAVEALRQCDLLVRSPGVSIYGPELQTLLAEGLEVTTATALWMAERGGRRIIGITGTKGKSTTAMLASHLIRSTGRRVGLGGNIGLPALDLIDHPADEWAVIELSSYQTADLPAGPEVAVLTNLYREHMDWHRTEENYRSDKLRMFGLPGVREAVLPIDADTPPGIPSVSVTRFGGDDNWHLEGEGIVHPDGARVEGADIPLRGRHNRLNLCAALAAIDAAGLERPDLPGALVGAEALPHRLQSVARRGGVEWVDDSISTTPESTSAALESYSGRSAVLIAGGLDRGQDYSALGELLAREDVAVLGLPTTGERLVSAAIYAGATGERARKVRDMEQAVEMARELSVAGGVVLLSPAAPSYNTYRNFEERGHHFAELVGHDCD